MKQIFLLLTVMFGAWAVAAPKIEVPVTWVARQSLALAAQGNGQAGQMFVKTLKNDLARSGWYRMTTGNAQVNVTGSVAGDAGANEALAVAWPGKRFAWNRGAGSLAQARQHAHELADTIVSSTTGEVGIAQSKFALVCKTGRAKNGVAREDLYVCDYDGHNLRRLTHDNAPIVGPRWSADGSKIYFTSYRLGFAAVFVAEVATGRVTRLANFRGLNTGAVPSPTNPNMIAIILSHQGNPELYTMDVRTKHLTRLTKTKLAAEASPCWSPDGKQICYVSDATGSPQLYIVDVATKRTRRLTLKGGENVQPDWGKQGIVFATKRGAPYRIAMIDPNVGEPSLRFLTPVNDQYESPSWAANGRHVVAARTLGRQSSIWVIDAAEKGEKPYQPFSGGNAQWLNPAWSKSTPNQ